MRDEIRRELSLKRMMREKRLLFLGGRDSGYILKRSGEAMWLKSWSTKPSLDELEKAVREQADPLTRHR